MPTRVIHIRQSTKADDEVYIGRAGHGEDGRFGNPIRVNERCFVCNKSHIDPGSTVLCFSKWFNYKIEKNAVYRQEIEKLKDKTLKCFCRPPSGFAGNLLCHGQVIAGWLDNRLPTEIE